MDRSPILLDTNVLLRLPDIAQSKDIELLSRLSLHFQPSICFQNLAEFWSVATRSTSSNGLGLSNEVVSNQITWLQNTFKVLFDLPETIDIWKQLCLQHSISGRRVHDIKMAATAISNGVAAVLTNNTADFAPISELKLFTPNDILQLPGANQ